MKKLSSLIVLVLLTACAANKEAEIPKEALNHKIASIHVGANDAMKNDETYLGVKPFLETALAKDLNDKGSLSEATLNITVLYVESTPDTSAAGILLGPVFRFESEVELIDAHTHKPIAHFPLKTALGGMAVDQGVSFFDADRYSNSAMLKNRYRNIAEHHGDVLATSLYPRN